MGQCSGLLGQDNGSTHSKDTLTQNPMETISWVMFTNSPYIQEVGNLASLAWNMVSRSRHGKERRSVFIFHNSHTASLHTAFPGFCTGAQDLALRLSILSLYAFTSQRSVLRNNIPWLFSNCISDITFNLILK